MVSAQQNHVLTSCALLFLQLHLIQVFFFIFRSMVDVFVLLMTLASFNISINSPEIAFLPEGLYGLTMLVVPRWGLYANMVSVYALDSFLLYTHITR